MEASDDAADSYLALLAVLVRPVPPAAAPAPRLTERHRSEIESVNVSTAYEVVNSSVPSSCGGAGRRPSGTGAGMPVVYVNGVRYGSVEVLGTCAAWTSARSDS